MVTSDRVFEVDAALDAYADGWFDEGLLGDRRERRRGLRGQSLDAGGARARAVVAARLGIEVGDKFRIAPGCHKRVVEDCRDKFRIAGSQRYADGNARNFRGEPFVPGSVAATMNPRLN